jgi:hypothetical protein
LSSIKTPIGDNESLLDISSAARGELSVTPYRATKQPTKYPIDKNGSFYMFDPDVNGENSWESLKAMLAKVGCVSGCSLVLLTNKKILPNEKQLIICVVLMDW